MPQLVQIESALAAFEPQILRPPGVRRAAVALVLREGADGQGEILFIERARHGGDPWSGQMAFPGGRVDPGDRDELDAARRETLEEVGVCLDDARLLGRLDDLEGRNAGRPAGLVISGFVFHHPSPAVPVGNYEVADVFWFPLRELRATARHVEYARAGGAMRFPGIVVGDPERHVVWGLTYRFVELFFGVVGLPLPDRWDERHRVG